MASSPVAYSDLEVYPQPIQSNLEVTKGRDERDTYKEAQHIPEAMPEYAPAFAQTAPSKRICGLPPKRFYIIAAIGIFVLLAAAIGGGVGGSLANKKDGASSTASINGTAAGASASSSQSSISSSITPAPTTKELVTVTTAYASTTLYPDCPSSNDTLYKAADNDAYLFRKICSNSYYNSDGQSGPVSKPASTLDECIGFCVSYNVEQHDNISVGKAPICNAVCWRATIQDDDWPGQCFGFRLLNDTSNFKYSGDTRCDSAAWINPTI